MRRIELLVKGGALYLKDDAKALYDAPVDPSGRGKRK
jgi:hypothetical protein